MPKLTKIAGDCPDVKTCPAVWATPADEYAYVQGEKITDPDILAQLDGMPDHETVVRIPRRLLEEAAR